MTAFTRAPQKPSPFSVFRNRSFALLWLAQLISAMGTSLSTLAASIFVFRETGSTMSVGLMLIATAAPTLFVGLIAGVFVDRYDRKRIMIAADIIRAMLIGLVPFLIPVNIAWIYIIVAMSSTFTQFFDPAMSSLMPEIASDDELAQANSFMSISSVGATTVGFVMSGVIASQFPIEWAFWINTLTFIMSAICISMIKAPPMKAEEDTNVSAVFNNLKAGVRYIGTTPILRSLMIISAPIIFLFGFMNTLQLPFIIDVIGTTEFQYTLVEAAQAVGLAIAGLLMAQITDRLREGQWLAISWIAMGFLSLAFSLSTRYLPALIFTALVGFFNAPSFIGRQLIIQRNTPRDMRGRVASAFYVARDMMFIIGMLLAGLGDVIDLRLLWIVSSIALIFVSMVTLILPGLGQPAAEWKRAMTLLRGMKTAPGMSTPRAATLADIDVLAGRVPALASLGRKNRVSLAAQTLVSDAAPGTVIIRKGEVSDAAYFILSGKAVAGLDENGEQRLLETLLEGDFFGEIAALTGVPRTANVIAEDQTRVLQVPAPALRHMNADPVLNRMLMSKMTERMVRMNLVDLPRAASMDQNVLRDLRTETAS